MAKIKNNFLKATIQKDLDERLTPNDQMTDAENVMVVSENNGNVGVVKNIKGNVLKTNYNIYGSETIGSVSDDKNNRCFYFVVSPSYDYIIEYNTITDISEIVLQSTHGTGVLNLNSSYRISHSDIFRSIDGEDFLSWTDGLNPPRIVNIQKAKTYSIDGFTSKEISVMKPSPIFAPSISSVNIETDSASNFLEDKFLQFAYRYKYEGGFYSAISSWSEVAFVPNKFSLDYQTYENLGMINLANAVNISFNVGDRHVIGIDLLFKESESSTVYVIDKFIKEEEGWTTSNANVTYTFSGNKIYSVLEESQYFRNFDNVPLTALTQAKVGNRLIYGNFTEGMDINQKVSLSVDYVSSDLTLEEKEGQVYSFVDDVNLYSNVVDFERGVDDGGLAPVDQMNYSTNEVEMSISGAVSADFIIEVTPKSHYSSSEYNILVMEGVTVIDSWIGLIGNNTRTYTTSTDRNIRLVITSDDGLIYDLKLNYNIIGALGVQISRYDYFANDQLCYPISTSYGTDFEGDTVIQRYVEFDFTNFNFEQGNQIRFEFELQSSLVFEVKPSLTYFYTLENNYTDLQDFLLNSSFVENIEGVFSTSFVEGVNAFASNAGVRVTYDGFKIDSTLNVLRITTPKIIYTVTEDSGNIEDKVDFYLINSVLFKYFGGDSFKSMHSNRDYTCDIIYLDSEGRKTTVLSGGSTSIYIPAEESAMVNKLVVTTNSNPPSEARYYKFAIKETKRVYNTIYGNVVYEDGIYRWIKLVGENKNKVKEGDVLILKSDFSGVTEANIQIKVLEVATNQRDFIPNNLMPNGDDLIEESGLYFKIKQGAFDINVPDNSFVTYEGFGKRRYATRSFVTTSPLFGEYDDTNTFVPTPIPAGTKINFTVRIWAKGAIAFDHRFEVDTFAQEDYDSMKSWWDAEVSTLSSWSFYADSYLRDYQWNVDDGFGTSFKVKPWRDGTASRDIMTKVSFDVVYTGGNLVFENYEAENLNNPYFESVETYKIVNGQHFSGNTLTPNIHTLNRTFNCFCFGNGIESNTIRDSFSGKKFYINSNATSISDDEYRKINRFADLTYSGVYQESTSVNKLNEFNLSLANYKDDIEKKYGKIVKLDSDETDLLVIQENKWSKVLYGKSLLYNADATTNVSRIEDVLGQQVMYSGEYGISNHPESYVKYGSNSYCTDLKRGVVLRLNNTNGLSEISSFGMRDYFKKLFRDNQILNIIGSYDPFFDLYVVNVKYVVPGKNYAGLEIPYDYVTWSFSDEAQGFLGRQSFNPDSMVKVNNDFISFKGANLYKHNIGPYNTFYGTRTKSLFEFNFNEEPSTRKIFKNISIEGNASWNTFVRTEMQNGFLTSSDYKNKEEVYYGYIRGNDSLDFSTLSVFGIGEVSLILGSNYYFKEIPSALSVGDTIRTLNGSQFGTVTDITKTYITINVIPGLPFSVGVGTFLLASKSSVMETSGIRGYYMNTRLELDTSEYAEVFAVNSEVAKSFE